MPSLRVFALEYFESGWHPLELPAGAKAPPPDGLTGYGGRDMTRAEIEAAAWAGNLGLRMPPDVIGLDVDVYHGGDVTLNDLLARCGSLPNTWISHSGRNDGSGIRFYRVPRMLWVHSLPGIEIIQYSHRYAVVFPSTHPDGRPYGWFDQAEGGRAEGLPAVEGLPELPWAWIRELSRAELDGTTNGRGQVADPAGVAAFVAEHQQAEAPGYLANAVVAHFTDRWNAGYSRHDTMQHCLLWALESARAGVMGAGPALDALGALWARSVAPDARRAELHSAHRTTEWSAMVRHAVGRVESKTEDEIWAIRNSIVGPTMRVSSPAGAELEPAPPPLNLPEGFWERPELAAVRDWAHARMRSADAVYAAVRARLCVLVPHALTIDTSIAVPISLNALVAVIGSSGAGKTTSSALGRVLVPITRTDVFEGPLGSGEGVAEVFYEWREEPKPSGKGTVKVKVRVRTAALLLLDEGEALTRMAERAGTTILPTLRSAYSGELLGQANARQETLRVLPAGSYRLVLLVGLQDVAAAQLFADSATGTPQRVVMFHANDPTIPAEPPDAPVPWPAGPWVPPAITGGQTIELEPEVLTEVRERALAVQRGALVLDTLDAHRDQNRLKEAAMLAILAHRLRITVDDWRLAGMILDASDSMRRWVIERARAATQKAEDERTSGLVRRQRITVQALDVDTHERAVVGGARAMARRARRSAPEPVSRRELERATAGKQRQDAGIDEMLAWAEEKDWLKPAGEAGWVAGGSAPT